MSRLDTLLDRLQKFYGALPAPPRDPFTLFVWEVLSVHSTPRKRDAALAALKRIRALTPDAMSRAAHAKLEASVGLAGPYAEQRLRALKTGVDLFRRSPASDGHHQRAAAGRAPRAEAVPADGRGRRSSDAPLRGRSPVLPVDARVSRVGLRLGYGEPGDDFRKTSRAVQSGLTRELPHAVEACRRAFQYLSHHGATTCTETDPHCHVCPLVTDCPEGRKRVGN